MAPELAAELTDPLPPVLPVGLGGDHPLYGMCAPPERPVDGVRLLLDGVVHDAWLDPEPHPWDAQGRHAFWGWVPLRRLQRPQPLQVELEATLADGTVRSAILGETLLTPDSRRPLDLPEPGAPGPRIVVCMATFNPDPELFARQLASLRAQTLESWVCIVCDDRSDPAGLETVRAGCATDPRFVLIESGGRRRGPYDNFQRALELVPRWADAVAFSDQDDEWYPHKLATLWERLESSGAQLAYSDVRIVSERGEVLAETYWTNRRNNSTNLASLLVANTVTGAAAMLRASLLDVLLPFPAKINGVMHDWWAATAALTVGELVYVEEPLHDYVQHGANVLGHQAPPIERPTAGEFAAFLRRGVPGQRGFDEALLNAREAYFNHTRRVMLSARVLQHRAGAATTPSKRAVLRRVAGLDRSAAGFAWLTARGTARAGRKSDTLGRDTLLARGVAWRLWASRHGTTAPLP